ncbi:MAG: tryptophan-rich sensory protein [Candidatus Omnitrophica bacterium]|nr:tryptophan-rich sensory protein [Candidatus Omnitrophota bacterium]
MLPELSSSRKSAWVVLGWVGLCPAVGALSSRFEPGVWCETLVRPAFTPPDAVFPVGWSILYRMMGLAAALIWQQESSRMRTPGLRRIAECFLLLAQPLKSLVFRKHV